MLQTSSNFHQPNLFGNDLLHQLDCNDPLITLANAYDWKTLETKLQKYYVSNNGRPAKPIRLMAGLLLLKQLENLSDEEVVIAWKRNPYYQYFCGFREFQVSFPCHATELVKFRAKIGTDGTNEIFKLSVVLHPNKKVNEKDIIVDSTVQEKNITYPTDGKLAIKIINGCVKVAKKHNLKLVRTYAKEVKEKRIALRGFGHPKTVSKAKKAMKRLKTIASELLREVKKRLPKSLRKQYLKSYAIALKVLSQEKNSKNKIYSLHESHIYAMAKGKDNKKYEYGTKASIAITKNSKIIVGVVAHDTHIHDSKTLQAVIEHASTSRTKPIELAICDRGYAGVKTITVTPSPNNKFTKNETTAIQIPSKPKLKDTQKEKQIKRNNFRKRASIEPVIGHVKHDFRLNRNFLKGFIGDEINLLLAAAAWNMKKWMNIFFWAIFLRDIELALLAIGNIYNLEKEKKRLLNLLRLKNQF